MRIMYTSEVEFSPDFLIVPRTNVFVSESEFRTNKIEVLSSSQSGFMMLCYNECTIQLSIRININCLKYG